MTVPGNINAMLLGGQSSYKIERSLRFNSADSAFLGRAVGTTGNRTQFTWSGWVKRSTLGVGQNIFGGQSGGLLDGGVFLDTNDTLGFSLNGNVYNKYTTAVLRDCSAWYHTVVAFDSPNATAANRIRIYINGVEQTNYTTQNSGLPPQNHNSFITLSGADLAIGKLAGYSQNYFSGYLTEVHFIDGQALTPSSFGEINPVTGVWQPKKYTGTYGTNGFYLNFADNSGTTSTTLGQDSSGNGNNWTPNNFSVTAGAGNDSMSDTPTYNCATLSVAHPSAWAQNISESGRVQYASAYNGGYLATLSSQVDPKQDFYFEFQAYTNGDTAGSGGCPCAVVFTDGDLAQQYPSQSSTWSFAGAHFTKTLPTLGFLWFSYYNTAGQDQAFYENGSGTSPGTYLTPISGSCKNSGIYQGGGANYSGLALTGVYYNASAKTITLYGSNEDGTGAQSAVYSVANWATDFNKPWAIHAQTQFQSGFYGGGYVRFFLSPSEWRIATRPSMVPAPGAAQQREPTIKKPSSYMDVVTYTGTGSALTPTSSLGFSPDLVWIKSRSAATDHALYDAVRGAEKRLESNNTDAEVTSDSGVTAFNSAGFTLGTLAQVNTNTATYAAWCWDKSATPGFDIVTYTGTGSAQTIAHSLGVAPSMIIVKNRTTGSTGWIVYHSGVASPTTGGLRLNLTDAFVTYSFYWNNTAPTSSVFTVGTDNQVNGNGDSMVAYLWSEVAGFSKFGSYTGNGSSDGPFVYCGFRPRWVMIKRSNSTGNWCIYDTARETYNLMTNELCANLASAENPTVNTDIDVLSSGLKLRGGDGDVNYSGHTYIFAAFAESPFKHSLAR